MKLDFIIENSIIALDRTIPPQIIDLITTLKITNVLNIEGLIIRYIDVTNIVFLGDFPVLQYNLDNGVTSNIKILDPYMFKELQQLIFNEFITNHLNLDLPIEGLL